MGAFPKAAPCLLCSNSPNSLFPPYCSGDTPVTIEFPTDPGFSTSLSLKYLQAVFGFFPNARCITAGRSSPASAGVSGPSDLKEYMVNAVRSPALRACTFSTFVIYGADMGVFPLMGSRVRPSGAPRKMVPLCHVPSQCSPYCDVLLNCSYGACGHTPSVVLYGHEVIGAVSYVFPHWKLRRGRIHLVVVMCAV